MTFNDNMRKRDEEERLQRAQQPGASLPLPPGFAEELRRSSVKTEVTLEVIAGKTETERYLRGMYAEGWRLEQMEVLPKEIPGKKTGAEYHLFLTRQGAK